MSGYPAKVKSFDWVGNTPYLVTSGANQAICWPFDGKDGPKGRKPICVADGGCIEACPVGVYEWMDAPGNPASEKKPLMSKEPDCIFCLACEGVCPPQAIKIFEQK